MGVKHGEENSKQAKGGHSVEGIYVLESKWVKNPIPSIGGRSGWSMTYAVLTPDLLAKLPRANKIMGGSTALILSSGQVKMLTETGWDKDV